MNNKVSQNALIAGMIAVLIILIFAACDGGEFQAPAYTIVYDANGGEGEMEATEHVYGTAQNLRQNTFTPPQGYVFAGWARSPAAANAEFMDGQSVLNLTDTRDAVIQLYAVWHGVNFTVQFNPSGGGGSMADTNFTYGTAQVLPQNVFTPPPDYGSFSGWAVSPTGAVQYANGSSVSNLMPGPDGKVTLYAVWTFTFTVAFDANGGSGSMASITLSSSAEHNLSLNTFTRTGYTFAGWARSSGTSTVEFTNGQSVNNLASTPGQTVTLYAVWQFSYTVVFDATDGTGFMASITLISNAEQSLPPNAFIPPQGHSFAGWTKNSETAAVEFTDEQSVNNLATTPGQTITLYAVWHLWSGTVAFDANGGTGNMAGFTIIYGEERELPSNTFTRSGYSFAGGWSRLPSAEGAEFADGQNVNMDDLGLADGETVTLYAVWESGFHVPGDNLAQKLSWLRDNAASSNAYILTISGDNSLGPHTFFPGTLVNVRVTLRGIGTGATIQLSSSGSMFTVPQGLTLVLDNITLKGISSGNHRALITISSGGTLIMNVGSSITGNNSNTSGSSSGAGVHVIGTFTMNGGTISENRNSTTVSYGGGIYVDSSGVFTMNNGSIFGNSAGWGGSGVYINRGTFTMNGGTISHNYTTRNNTDGGGVDVSSGTFNMSGGIITGNTSTRDGGGVFVGSSGTFNMSSGVISGNTTTRHGGGVYSSGRFDKTGGTIYGSDAGANDKNTANGTFVNGTQPGGHAVCARGNNQNRVRDTTHRPEDGRLFVHGAENAGMWDGIY